jgi:hypothetical protein
MKFRDETPKYGKIEYFHAEIKQSEYEKSLPK